jgi:hypothetical protein
VQWLGPRELKMTIDRLRDSYEHLAELLARLAG